MLYFLHLPIPVSGGWAALAGCGVAAFAPIAVTGVVTGSGLACQGPDKCHFYLSIHDNYKAKTIQLV